MFKKLIAILMTMLLTLSVAGCGSSSSAPAKSEPPKESAKEQPKEQPKEEKIEMVWSGWSGEEASTKPSITGMIDSWNAKNPNATVKWVGWPYGDALKQLVIRTQGNETLDVAQVDMGWLKTLSDADVLLDLSTVFDAAWLKDNFEEASLKVGQMNGKQIALPWTIASIGTVYNPALLEKAGVKEVPKTIQEFEEVLKKLKESDSSVIPYGVSTKDATLSADFYPWLWAFGGSIFDNSGNVVINNEAGVKTLTWYKSLIDKGYIKMDVSRFDARTLYSKNKIGFYNDAIMAKGILKSNGVADADLNKYIKPMLRPVVKAGDNPQSSMWGHTLVIFKKSKNAKKAAEYIKHLVSEEQSLTYFKNTGMLPVMKSAMKNDTIQKDEWSKSWLEITKNGKVIETNNYKQKGELDTIVMEEVQAALTGKKAPQKALDDAAARIKSSVK